jgi:hypothetical protein
MGPENEPMRETFASPVMSRPLIVAGVVIVAAVAGTVWLWSQYGSTIFFETIRAGFAACFG